MPVESLRRFRTFLDEVWAELKRTSWPNRQEVYGTTIVVIVTVVLIAAYLWVVDLTLAALTTQLFRLVS